MFKKTFLYSSLLIFLLTAFGCGQNILKGMEDKESNDAQQYSALKSLDSGEFLDVLSACDEGTADPLDCSAAALGAAGLDPLDIARQLNEQIDSLGSTAAGDVSSIGGLSNLDPSYLDEIHSANEQLAAECEETGDQDVCSQLVITSIAEIVIAIAQVGSTSTEIDLDDGIQEGEAVIIAGMITDSTTVLAEDTDGDGTPDPTPIIDVIGYAVLDIINNINKSPLGGDTNGDGKPDTELGQILQEQAEAIGGSDCAAGSENCVDANDIKDYLNTEYAKP